MEDYGFWDAAREKRILRRGIKVCSVVGTILILINQWEAVFGDAPLNPLKVVLTYMVPFCVTVYSGASGLVEFRKEQLSRKAKK